MHIYLFHLPWKDFPKVLGILSKSLLNNEHEQETEDSGE